MNADECRRKAQYFLILSRQMSRPEDRAAMVQMASLWMGRARFYQQQVQQPEPVSLPRPGSRI
jgi:hypothetical protein